MAYNVVESFNGGVWGTAWHSLCRDAGLRLLQDEVDVERCLVRYALKIMWTGRNGKRYSHTIHEVEERPGGYFRQAVVDEFKVKVMMSLA